MDQNKYIHYGHRFFDKELFIEIKNESCFVKPIGGLWASRVNTRLGWKDWCEREHFRACRKENSFQFKLKDNTKILQIKNVKDLERLPKIDVSWIIPSHSLIYLDFEKIAKEYDAIEVLISSDEQLYWDLYGWDCDSLLVMNPNCIKAIEDE